MARAATGVRDPCRTASVCGATQWAFPTSRELVTSENRKYGQPGSRGSEGTTRRVESLWFPVCAHRAGLARSSARAPNHWGVADTIYIEGFSRDCVAWRQRRTSLLVPGEQLVERRVSGGALIVLDEVTTWETNT